MMVATLPDLAPYRAPNPAEPAQRWSGYITAENVHHVAATVAALLGDRRFTIVTVHEYRGWSPEVHTGCRLARDRTSGELVDSHHYESEHGLYRSDSIGFSAGNYSWGFSTRLETQPPWFWLYEPDAELAAKARDRGETHRDDLGYMHGSGREVLDYIDAALLADID